MFMHSRNSRSLCTAYKQTLDFVGDYPYISLSIADGSASTRLLLTDAEIAELVVRVSVPGPAVGGDEMTMAAASVLAKTSAIAADAAAAGAAGFEGN